MRISDWSSDVCSSDRICDLSESARAPRPGCRGRIDLPPGSVRHLQFAERRSEYLCKRVLYQDLVHHLPRWHEAGIVELDGQYGAGGVDLRRAPLAYRRRRHLRAADLFAHRAYVLCRSEEHTSELQSLMRNSYAVFCLKKKKNTE